MTENRSPAQLNQLSDFDFELPPHLIAQHPAQTRSASRLLDARTATPVDRIFNQLPELIRAGDLLVFNDTKVIKARLFGTKQSGGRLELLIERVLPKSFDQTYYPVAAHMRVSKKPRAGDMLHMEGGFKVQVLGRWPNPEGPLYLMAFQEDPFELMQKYGHVPLPPYVSHTDDQEDVQRYQSIFAKTPGAVAAPTASLHFDSDLMNLLSDRGVETAHLTLHIGAGTFQPVKSEDINLHMMHSEWYNVPKQTLEAIMKCKSNGGRVIAVGTTTVRTLESWASTGLTSADTSIFIRPGFNFKVIDAMITNFHLPKSTLLMLVSAFAGYEHIFKIYRYAIDREYRFFSYGDAMFLTKQIHHSA